MNDKKYQPIIWSRYCLLLISLIISCVSFAADNAKISVQDAHNLSSSNDVVLVDLRSEREWAQTGVAPNAKLVTIHRQGGLKSFKDELTALLDGNKDQKVALICAGGVRSSRVQQYLQQQGFTQVLDVNEGMLGGFLRDGWIDQGLPVKPYTNQ